MAVSCWVLTCLMGHIDMASLLPVVQSRDVVHIGPCHVAIVFEVHEM